jgi:putative DNA primase/helicase
MRPIEVILPKLEGVSPGASERQWTACCPAHEDAKQSLGVALGSDDRVLVKCYAGCTFKAIATAMGLESKDFFPAGREKADEGVTVGRLAFDKKLPDGWLRSVVGLTDLGGVGDRHVGIPYRDRDGVTLFIRTRHAVRAKDGTKQPKGTKLKPYGLWRLKDSATTSGGRMIVVEGETDCWALWHHGYAAIGIPGADAMSTVTAEIVSGFTNVYVWRETDEAGKKFSINAAERLSGIPGVTVLVMSADGIKDPCEMHQRFDTTFNATFDAAIAAAKPPEHATTPAKGRPLILPPSNVPEPTPGTPQPSFPLTDYGNAERFSWQYARDVRYVWHGDKSGEWFAWDGKRWSRNCMPRVSQMAMNTVRSIYKETELEDDATKRQAVGAHAMKSESWQASQSLLRHAATLKSVAASIEHFDCERFFFTVQNGTIDLTTGKLHEHKQTHYGTHLSPVSYDADAKCPTWDRFLRIVFSKDPDVAGGAINNDLINFMQRMLGYCLTGDVSEHFLSIFWGDGANGKSTLLNVMADILGSGYAAKAPQGLLMKKHNEEHPTELTVLQGARFVYASETSRGARLSEELVKDLTSGEKITARRMRMDFYSFDPTHKLILCTNHMPRISETDDGIWRRVRLVPFRARFWNPDSDSVGPDHLKQDKSLGERLKREYPGILNWLIEGALLWRESGMSVPESVKRETDNYRAEEDTFGQFVSEALLKTNSAPPLLLKTLCEKYRTWCESQNTQPMNNRNVASELRRRGVRVEVGHSNLTYCKGITIKHGSATTSSLHDYGD